MLALLVFEDDREKHGTGSDDKQDWKPYSADSAHVGASHHPAAHTMIPVDFAPPKSSNRKAAMANAMARTDLVVASMI